MNDTQGAASNLISARCSSPEISRLEGEFVAPRDELECELVQIWEQALDIPGIGIRDSYYDLVLRRYADNRLIDHVSYRAVGICSEIDSRLGKSIPVAAILQAPTIEMLAEVLRQEKPTMPLMCLVPIRTEGSRPPLFVVHGAGAHVNFLYYLAQRLDQDQPLYGFQSLGLSGVERPHQRIEDMAAQYISEMRAVQPQGPYYIGGRSLGGVIAVEMALQLQQKGQDMAFLGLLDSYRPNFFEEVPDNRSIRERTRLDHHIENVKRLNPGEALKYSINRLQRIFQRHKKKLRKHTWNAASSFYQGIRQPLPDSLQNVKLANHRAFKMYRSKVYLGNAVLFRAMNQPKRWESLPDLGWTDLITGHLEIHEVPGEHGTIYYRPHVDALAATLEECLARARTATARR